MTTHSQTTPNYASKQLMLDFANYVHGRNPEDKIDNKIPERVPGVAWEDWTWCNCAVGDFARHSGRSVGETALATTDL